MTYGDFKAAVLASGGTVTAHLTEDGYRIIAIVDDRRYAFDVEAQDGRSLATVEHPAFERNLRTIRNVLRGHDVPVFGWYDVEREDPSVNYSEVD